MGEIRLVLHSGSSKGLIITCEKGIRLPTSTTKGVSPRSTPDEHSGRRDKVHEGNVR